MLKAWGIEATPADLTRTPTGSINEKYIVDARCFGRQVVLGRHLHDRRVATEARATSLARSAGIPTPPHVPSLDGRTVVDVEGSLWSVQEWASGTQTPRADIDARQAAAMGRMLARIHEAFARVPLEGERPEVVDADPAGTTGRVDELLAAIDAHRSTGAVERRARTFLEGLAAAHAAGRDAVAPAPLPPEDVQLVHGDYHDGNVFFAGGEVSAVIDWERCRPWWPAMELVRCLALSFDLEPRRCRAMVDAYRSSRPIPLDELDRAAAVYGYERAHDLWLFRAIYLEGNDRARVFVTDRPYVPFADRWAALSRT